MSTTILAELAEQSARLRARELAIEAREALLDKAEADLAASLEAFTAARQESSMWAEATAAERRRWLLLIDQQLGQLQRKCNTSTVLRRLAAMGREVAV